MVPHICHPTTQKSEGEGSVQVQGQPKLLGGDPTKRKEPNYGSMDDVLEEVTLYLALTKEQVRQVEKPGKSTQKTRAHERSLQTGLGHFKY